MLNEITVPKLYKKLLAKYGYDMEAYAEVSQHIVQQNESNPTRIGRLMKVLHEASNQEE